MVIAFTTLHDLNFSNCNFAKFTFFMYGPREEQHSQALSTRVFTAKAPISKYDIKNPRSKLQSKS